MEQYEQRGENEWSERLHGTGTRPMSGSVFGADRVGKERRCVLCGNPTRSHKVPNGYLCHSCLGEHTEDEVIEHLGGVDGDEITLESVMKCKKCADVYWLHEARRAGEYGIAVVEDCVPFSSLTTVVIVSCPSCSRATEYLTRDASGEALAEKRGVVSL